MSAYKARPGDRTNVLVAYASKHGATEEIAKAIADELRAHGLDVDCLPADQVADPIPYEGVVLGSAIYMARWRRPARKFLSRHRDALAKRPLWVFSSGPLARTPTRPRRNRRGWRSTWRRWELVTTSSSAAACPLSLRVSSSGASRTRRRRPSATPATGRRSEPGRRASPRTW